MDTNDDLVPVYTVSNPVKAEIIKNALAEEGIRCFIEGENQAGEVGLIGIAIRLLVPAAQAEEAARFIAEHERAHAEEDEGDEAEDVDSETQVREGQPPRVPPTPEAP
jgi:hypothetical protein